MLIPGVEWTEAQEGGGLPCLASSPTAIPPVSKSSNSPNPQGNEWDSTGAGSGALEGGRRRGVQRGEGLAAGGDVGRPGGHHGGSLRAAFGRRRPNENRSRAEGVAKPGMKSDPQVQTNSQGF